MDGWHSLCSYQMQPGRASAKLKRKEMMKCKINKRSGYVHTVLTQPTISSREIYVPNVAWPTGDAVNAGFSLRHRCPLMSALNVGRRITSKTSPATFRSAEDRAMLIYVYEEVRNQKPKSLWTGLGEKRIKRFLNQWSFERRISRFQGGFWE